MLLFRKRNRRYIAMTDKDVIAALTEYSGKYPNVLELNGRSLVSIDYLANENAAVVDTRRINVYKGKMLKFVLWYDNEWGYSSRVYSYIKRLISH